MTIPVLVDITTNIKWPYGWSGINNSSKKVDGQTHETPFCGLIIAYSACYNNQELQIASARNVFVWSLHVCASSSSNLLEPVNAVQSFEAYRHTTVCHFHLSHEHDIFITDKTCIHQHIMTATDATGTLHLPVSTASPPRKLSASISQLM